MEYLKPGKPEKALKKGDLVCARLPFLALFQDH